MESEKKSSRPGRAKDQVAFQFPPHVAEWIETLEMRTTTTRGRLGITMLLCYEMQSFHVRGLCGILATAVDQGTLTLDEAVAFLRVHQPAVMQPVAPDVRPDAAHEYHVDKVAGLLVECFQVWANQAGGREKDWLVALDEQERIWAKERQEDAQKKVAQMIKKRVADQKSESQKMKRGK